MILLPSGQTLVIGTWRLTTLLRANERPDRDAIVLGFAHPCDLLPYCDLVRRHDSLDAAPARLIPVRQSANPPPMPGGTVDEELGVTAANWRAYSGGWSDEDAAAIAVWLADDGLARLFAAEWMSITRQQAAIRRRQAGGQRPPQPSPEEGERMAALEARILAAADRRALVPPLPLPLPFDWRDFPVDDFGGARLHYTSDCRLVIGGRPMRIHVLHQFSTYAGLLCGSPRDPESSLRAALALRQRHHPDDVQGMVATIASLAGARQRAGDHDDAIGHYRRDLELGDRRLGAGNLEVTVWRLIFGAKLEIWGLKADAETEWRTCVEAERPANDPRRLNALHYAGYCADRLARLYEAVGRADDARRVRAQAEALREPMREFPAGGPFFIPEPDVDDDPG